MIGRFHPLLVHLPIGFLLIAILFEWLSRKERFKSLMPAVPVSLLAGSLAALASCVTGYLLSLQGNYQENILAWHLAMGISTAVIGTGLFIVHRYPTVVGRKIYNTGCVTLLLVITVTGHLGGSLTHGATYLTDALPSPIRQWFSNSDAGAAMIVNIQDAKVYEAIVKPILDEKCVNCHGASRQKGGLRLDLPETIIKGGKKGKTVVPEKPFDSEMIKRIYLPINHDDHMPPKGKNPLTPAEAQLLQWWIATGAKFDKTVRDLPQPETIKPMLANLESTDPEKTIFANVDLPEGDATKVADSVLTSFHDKHITVVSVTRSSNFLMVSYMAVPAANDEMVGLLKPIAKNIVGLKLGNTRITDKALETAGQCENLFRLSLEHTAITDAGLEALKNLRQLQYLNLVGTPVTAKGILELQALKKLKKIYIYQTEVEEKDLPELKQRFPDVVMDRGGYQVPTFLEDTTKVTVKKK